MFTNLCHANAAFLNVSDSVTHYRAFLFSGVVTDRSGFWRTSLSKPMRAALTDINFASLGNEASMSWQAIAPNV
jgi:hypothetical protein